MPKKGIMLEEENKHLKQKVRELRISLFHFIRLLFI